MFPKLPRQALNLVKSRYYESHTSQLGDLMQFEAFIPVRALEDNRITLAFEGFNSAGSGSIYHVERAMYIQLFFDESLQKDPIRVGLPYHRPGSTSVLHR